MNRINILRIGSLVALAIAGCASPSSEPSGTGGSSIQGVGGDTGAGGTGMGGSPGTGGTPGTGGMGVGGFGVGGGGGALPGTGGRGVGGTPGTGGMPGTGGAQTTVPKVITSAPGNYWKTDGTVTVVTTGNADVTVNDTSMAQTFEGFGGAFNEMGWNYLSMLSATDRDRAIKLLFDATDGAHFVMGRIPIGASDYALQRYTDDETAGDTALTNFSISQDMKYLIPYVKAAQAVNGSIRLWASPWTPPTWMKANSGSSNGISCARAGNTAFDGGCMQDMAANLTALAQYFVKWIQAYAQQQITIETLAPQNEPSYAQGYPSALWAPALYTKFLPILNSALTGAGLSTKIMLGTMSNGDMGATSKDLQVVQAVMADSTAKGLVKVMGLQWGMLDLYEGKTSGVGPSNFMTGSLPVWATEHKCGNYPWNPSGYPAYKKPAPNDQAYGVES